MKKFGKILPGLFVLASVLFVTGCKSPSDTEHFTIHYESEYGTVPQDKTVESGYRLTEEDVADLEDDKFDFIRWYISEEMALPGTEVLSDITLTAKWYPKDIYEAPNDGPESGKDAGVSINITFSVKDIDVVMDEQNTCCVFTPEEGFTDYTWTLNQKPLDESCSVDGNGVLTFTKSKAYTYGNGLYVFHLNAKKNEFTYSTSFAVYFDDISKPWPASSTVQYILNNDKLYILGTGKIPDVTRNTPFGIDEIEQVTECTIFDGITEIGKYAFSSFTNLKTLKGAKNVTHIGFGAMIGTQKLTTIPSFDNITSMDNSVFSLSGITSVNGFNQLKVIPMGAFNECSSLTTITGFKNINKIAKNAFIGCSSLETFNFGGTQEEWGRISIEDNNAPLSSCTITYNN